MDDKIINILKEIKDEVYNLKDDIKEIKDDVKDLKIGQERLEKKLNIIEEQTAILTEFKNEIISKVNDIDTVTSKNCFEIVKLNAYKKAK